MEEEIANTGGVHVVELSASDVRLTASTTQKCAVTLITEKVEPDLIDLTADDNFIPEETEEIDPIIGDLEKEAVLTLNVNSVAKVCNVKRCANSRLMLVRDGFAERVFVSCFSDIAKKEYIRLIKSSKKTYVADSKNIDLGKALYVDEDINEDDFICLYRGRRMNLLEYIARTKAGAINEYYLFVAHGVLIDGFGVGHSGAMANHNCEPNAELEHDYLPGREQAPIGLLRAKRDIKKGEEIEVFYGYFNPQKQAYPNMDDLKAYIPCKCGSFNCVRVFRLKQYLK